MLILVVWLVWKLYLPRVVLNTFALSIGQNRPRSAVLEATDDPDVMQIESVAGDVTNPASIQLQKVDTSVDSKLHFGDQVYLYFNKQYFMLSNPLSTGFPVHVSKTGDPMALYVRPFDTTRASSTEVVQSGDQIVLSSENDATNSNCGWYGCHVMKNDVPWVMTHGTDLDTTIVLTMP